MPGLNGIEFQQALIEHGREGAAHFYNRARRCSNVRPGNEGRRRRLSPKAFQSRPIVEKR